MQHAHSAPPSGLFSPYLLEQLRSSMLSAKTRDECIALIDEALQKSAPSSGDYASCLAHVAEYLVNTADRGPS